MDGSFSKMTEKPIDMFSWTNGCQNGP